MSFEGDREFDPRKRAFSEEELRPQPIIKKSRKVSAALKEIAQKH